MYKGRLSLLLMNRLLLIGTFFILLNPATLTANHNRSADQNSDFPGRDELRKFSKANPERDFKESMKRSDLQFIGVNGFTTYLPGVSDKHQIQYMNSYGTRIIQGTADAFHSEEHAQLNEKAVEYAKKYNQLLLKHIDNVIGQTISEGLHRLKLKTDKQFVIEEPIGVIRGIYGKTPMDETVELYIQRGQVPFSEDHEWKLEDFKDKEIIGIAKLKASGWHAKGEIMIIRAMLSQQFDE